MNRKKRKTISEEKQEDPKDFDKQIEWGINTLLTIIEEFSKKNKLLDNGSSIFLQVSLFKVPECEETVKRRIILKHPPYADKPEVCFIVHDAIRRDRVKRTDDEMIDYTVDCYEEFFKKQKITGISTILPYHQLKCEYNTFELRRKLVNRFDIFLCSATLNNQDNFFKYLGKTFIIKNKFPISVKLPKLKSDYNPNVSKGIREAISSTVYRIKEGSSNITIKIGNTLNKKKAVKENLKIILTKISGSESHKLIPGGFENIRLMCLKTEKSKSVPIYISLDSGKKIPVPYVESNIPVRKSVEGELSTMMNKKVTVLPNGEIFVTPIDDENDTVNTDDENDDDYDDGDEDQDDETNYQTEKKSKKEIKKGQKRSREEVSDEEDDEDMEEAIEAAEQNYLSNWDENRDIS